MCSGISTACADGNTIYSAAVPLGRRHCPFQIQTRWPTRLATPGPTLSISPAPSLWGMISGADIGAVRPLRDFQSDGFTPEVFRCTRTSPGPGSGVWKRLGGGCHLNRAIGTLIEGAGFQFDRLETGYMRGPKPMTFMYEGCARPR